MRTPPASAYSFSMRADGREVGRWRRSGDRADVLHDLEAAKSAFQAEGDMELD